MFHSPLKPLIFYFLLPLPDIEGGIGAEPNNVVHVIGTRDLVWHLREDPALPRLRFISLNAESDAPTPVYALRSNFLKTLAVSVGWVGKRPNFRGSFCSSAVESGICGGAAPEGANVKEAEIL